MHARLARHVDPWKAGAAGERLGGAVPAPQMRRLAALAAVERPTEVDLQFTLPGGVLREAVHVAVRARGRYGFTCQRCLEAMELDCAVDSQVLVVADDAAARRLEGAAEVVVCAPGEMLDLAALVEDEVMLALPFAPRHDPGQCRAVVTAPDAASGAGAEPDAESGRDATRNPFAVLAALKGRDRNG